MEKQLHTHLQQCDSKRDKDVSIGEKTASGCQTNLIALSLLQYEIGIEWISNSTHVCNSNSKRGKDVSIGE